MARRRRDRTKECHWRRHVARWQSSGLSIRAYCRSEGLSEPSFHGWRRVLQERRRERQQARSASAAARRTAAAPTFVPVRLVGPWHAGPTLEVVVRGGRVVRVAAGFMPQTLRDVVAVLEGLPC